MPKRFPLYNPPLHLPTSSPSHLLTLFTPPASSLLCALLSSLRQSLALQAEEDSNTSSQLVKKLRRRRARKAQTEKETTKGANRRAQKRRIGSCISVPSPRSRGCSGSSGFGIVMTRKLRSTTNSRRTRVHPHTGKIWQSFWTGSPTRTSQVAGAQKARHGGRFRG